MRKFLSAGCCVVAMIAAQGQNANLTSWVLNTTNAPAHYWQVNGTQQNHTLTYVTLSDPADVQQVCYTNDSIWVQATGLPTEFGPFWNPGVPVNMNYTWRFPRNPTPAASPTPVPVTSVIAALVNGVPIGGKGNSSSYNSSTNSNMPNGDGLWNADAYYNEGVSLDTAYCGHPQQQGAYHSHATPFHLYSNDSTVHSPIVGFAIDGYPIYGPFGYSNATDSTSSTMRMETSFRLRSITQRDTLPDGTPSIPAGPNVSAQYPLGMYVEDYEYVAGLGDLDEHNGRFCVTPEYPNGTYAYFVGTTSTGAPKFPFYLGTTFYGEPEMLNNISNAITSIPSNTNCLVNSVASHTTSTFEIYPNPASGVLTIELSDAGFQDYEVFISDGLGRIVIHTALSADNTVVNLDGLPGGIYFVTLSNTLTGERSVSKLVVED
jgi:hypothetical protein